MFGKSIKVLLVEDNPGDARLIEELLLDAVGMQFDLENVARLEAALERLSEGPVDVTLLDLSLPDSHGLETLTRLNAQYRHLPIVVMTGLDDEAMGIEAVQNGAQDYLIKGQVDTRPLVRALNYAIERQQIADERESLIAELDAFAHTVAHDLKGPIGSVIVGADMLKAGLTVSENSNLQEVAEVVGNQSTKAMHIVDELLLLATMRNLDELETELLDMAAIVDEALQRLDMTIGERQAEVILPDEWPQTVGYGPWVEEVWVNYISNALKYGGQPPRVELGASVGPDGSLRFWVSDNGPGLSAEQQSRLFTPFTRIERVRAQGHGLGLSIVRRIVGRLDGQAGVESEGVPGRGSTFWFTLPTESEAEQTFVHPKSTSQRS